MDYTTFVAIHAFKRDIEPGDTITLTLRNEESDEGMFAQVQRLSDMFLTSYNFLAEEIALHPDQLTLIKQMGKSLDILIRDEEMGKLLGEILDLATMPTAVPLVPDSTLDVFTAVARFHYHKEQEQHFKRKTIEYIIDKLQERE